MLYEIEVEKLVKRTESALSIRFSKPNGFDYLPGQFMFITLEVGDVEVTKHLTISSSPTENFLEITKKLTGHPFAIALASLISGDIVKIKGPYGKFTLEDHDKVGMLSGGIGITPLRSMIKYSIDKALGTNMILIYSNRNEGDIAFKDEFEEIQRRNSNLKLINTITQPSLNWNGVKGRINSEMIKEYLPDYRDRIFYISGPGKMVNGMLAFLKDLDIPEKQIRKEFFSGFD